MCIEGILRLFIIFHLQYFLRNNRYCKAVEGLDIFEKLSCFEGCCVERILRLFTNFHFHRKVLIFLRNDSDCKDVDLYNIRTRYAVTESLDVMRNISWLASSFSKIKKPNKHCSGNQSVFAGVCIFDTISHIYPYLIFWFEFQLVDLRSTREIYKIERYRVKEC